jgi:hypothetical protein
VPKPSQYLNFDRNRRELSGSVDTYSVNLF